MQSESPIEPAAGIRTTRVVLALLVALWAALALWTWRHGATLFDVAARDAVPGDATGSDDPDAARVVTGGALPDAGSSDVAATAPEIDGASDPDTDIERGGASDAGAGGAGGEIAADASGTGEASDEVPDDADGGVEPTGPTGPDGELDVREPDGEPDGEPGGEAEPASPDADADPVAGADEGAGDVESLFELRRREEIDTLSRLLETLRFEPLDDTPSAASREPLERAFEILFLYPDTRLALVVESREGDDAASDRRLSRERGESVLDYLVSRGIERSRLSVTAGDGGGLPFGEHRVRVTVEDQGR